MKRMIEVEIAGKNCPLLLSVNAFKIFSEHFGTNEDPIAKIVSLPLAKQAEELVFVISVLMEEAARYLHLMTGARPAVFTCEQLGTIFSRDDGVELMQIVADALSSGVKTEIKAGESKNA